MVKRKKLNGLPHGISIINLCYCVEEAEAQTRVPREDLMCEENEEENTHICLPRSGHEVIEGGHRQRVLNDSP